MIEQTVKILNDEREAIAENEIDGIHQQRHISRTLPKPIEKAPENVQIDRIGLLSSNRGSDARKISTGMTGGADELAPHLPGRHWA
ncbi:hypothetical protein F1643_18150 [Azospirillum sp. INR13]|nr:hypothetical protein [Azospirillum sp. INR13]